jgi:AcrR family transcriptional regulator
MNTTHRPYAMTKRAATAAATRARILAAATDLFVERTIDGLTLEEVAQRADTTVRTILRAFAGKEGLLAATAAAAERRGHGAAPAGDIAAAAKALYADYEQIGDAVLHRLADEQRVPALKPHLDAGRASHRRWVEAVFAPFLDRVSGIERAQLFAALLVASDVYGWKLLRRDLGLGRSAAEAVLRRILSALTKGGS